MVEETQHPAPRSAVPLDQNLVLGGIEPQYGTFNSDYLSQVSFDIRMLVRPISRNAGSCDWLSRFSARFQCRVYERPRLRPVGIVRDDIAGAMFFGHLDLDARLFRHVKEHAFGFCVPFKLVAR